MKTGVVILVHGIRDNAIWVPKLRRVLEEAGFLVEPTNYGRFGLFDFIGRSLDAEDVAFRKLADQVLEIRSAYPDSTLHVIAHSFGTHLVYRLLRERRSVPSPVPVHQFGGKLILCGSILREEISLHDLRGQVELPVINEIGTRDVWPALARFLSDKSGAVGTYGFRRTGAVDRWHPGLRHGDFLTEEFCKEWWIPLLRGEEIRRSESPEKLPILIDLMKSYQLRTVWPILLLVATTVVAIAVLIFWALF